MSGSLGKISIHKSLANRTREAQFELVYTTYFDRIYTYAKILCHSQETAKDVVSEFFYNLWKNSTDLAAIEDLDAYFFVAIKNQSIKMLQARLREAGNQAEIPGRLQSIEMVNPEEILLEKELKSKMDSIVEALPQQCRCIFRLSREKGMSYTQIALELGISKETVKTQLVRAQKKLRNEILSFYKDKGDNVGKDIRLIGEYLLIMCLSCYELLK